MASDLFKFFTGDFTLPLTHPNPRCYLRAWGSKKSYWNSWPIPPKMQIGIFNDMTGLLQRLGWEMRVRGGPHFFRKAGVRDIINLHPAGSKAKSYQVRQVRNVLQSLGVL